MISRADSIEKRLQIAGTLVIIGLVIVFKEFALLGLCLCYIFFGPLRHWWRWRTKRGPA